MKSRSTQFGMRENTASPRQHAPRLAVNASSPQSARAVELLQEEGTASSSGTSSVEVFDLPLTEANEATAGEIREPSYRLPSGTGNVNFEPLLDVREAAKLLRIHPKTLRAKASRGEIPGIQIGRVWRFRASALDRWVERIPGSHQIPVE
jgi:excisionase family DNA binding protein